MFSFIVHPLSMLHNKKNNNEVVFMHAWSFSKFINNIRLVGEKSGIKQQCSVFTKCSHLRKSCLYIITTHKTNYFFLIIALFKIVFLCIHCVFYKNKNKKLKAAWSAKCKDGARFTSRPAYSNKVIALTRLIN